MSIEKCLKSMAMDAQCKGWCSERPIEDFGVQDCTTYCGINAETVLTQAERHVILYSMIYVEYGNLNLHPDVREHLWSRSSGATQLMKSYEDYPLDAAAGAAATSSGNQKKDYYTALAESPHPPNSSVGTIKADQTRIAFDLDVTAKSHHLKKIGINSTYLT